MSQQEYYSLENVESVRICIETSQQRLRKANVRSRISVRGLALSVDHSKDRLNLAKELRNLVKTNGKEFSTCQVPFLLIIITKFLLINMIYTINDLASYYY